MDEARSTINWRLVGYTVAACWVIASGMCLMGKTFAVFLNPIPILVKGLVGGAVYGYVGSTSGHNFEAIFVYWTVFGLLLSWCLHETERKRVIIIVVAAVIHFVASALALFPAMILGGR